MILLVAIFNNYVEPRHWKILTVAYFWFHICLEMVLKFAALFSAFSVCTLIIYYKSSKTPSDYCAIEKLKCGSVPHIGCSYKAIYGDSEEYNLMQLYEFNENEIKFLVTNFNHLKNLTAAGDTEDLPPSSIYKKIVWSKELALLAQLSVSNLNTETTMPCLATHKHSYTDMYYNYHAKSNTTVEQSIEATVQNFLEDVLESEVEYLINHFAPSKYIGCAAAEFKSVDHLEVDTDDVLDPDEMVPVDWIYGVQCIFDINSAESWLTEYPEQVPCSECGKYEKCDTEFTALCTDKYH